MRMQIISVSHAGILYNRNFAGNLTVSLNLPFHQHSNVRATGSGIVPRIPGPLAAEPIVWGATEAPMSEGG